MATRRRLAVMIAARTAIVPVPITALVPVPVSVAPLIALPVAITLVPPEVASVFAAILTEVTPVLAAILPELPAVFAAILSELPAVFAAVLADVLTSLPAFAGAFARSARSRLAARLVAIGTFGAPLLAGVAAGPVRPAFASFLTHFAPRAFGLRIASFTARFAAELRTLPPTLFALLLCRHVRRGVGGGRDQHRGAGKGGGQKCGGGDGFQ